MSLPAFAQEVTIDDDRTSTVRTSTADGGSPGDVTISPSGSITVEDGTAVVIDSSNLLVINGVVESTDRVGGVGIDVLTGDNGITSGIELSGIIALDGDFQDNEEVVGGPNVGIRLGGAGTFTGNITSNSGSEIVVFGTDSVGLDLGSAVDGSISLGGTLAVQGENSIGLAVRSSVSGDIENSGSIQGVSFGGETGMLIEGAVSGSVLNLGAITTGRNQIFDNDFNVLPQESGGPGVFIAADVARGFVNGPPVIPEDPDEDGDGIVDLIPGTGATIAARGDGKAVVISATRSDGSMGDVTLGAFGTGDEAFGFINRGTLQADSQETNFVVNTVRIEGAQSGSDIFQTTLEGGFLNDTAGVIRSDSIDQSATSISVGSHTILPLFQNNGTITAQSTRTSDDSNSDGVQDTFGPGGDAFGIVFEENVSVDRIVNTGSILVSAAGETSVARAILDLSGNVTVFENSGILSANTPSNPSGLRIAADFSRSTSDMTLTNSGTIFGDVLLGAGNDIFSMDGGTLTGALDFGAGQNRFTLANEALFSGALSGEDIDLVVSNSSFATTNIGTTNVRTARFEDGSELILSLQGNALNEGALIASGDVTIGADTMIDPNFFAFPATGTPLVLISADQLILGDSLENLNLQLGLSSIIFEQSLGLQSGDRDELVVNLRRRTAEEIGLSRRRGALFEASIAGLQGDNELGGAIANLETKESLESVLDQVAPEAGEMPRYSAVTNQSMALGILSQRFSSLRKDDGVEFANSARLARASARRSREVSTNGLNVWLQEIGYVANRDTVDDVTGFDGETVGFAAGIDKPLFNLDALGFSIMQTVGDYSDDLAGKDEFDVLSTQFNVYGSYSTGGFFVDAIGTFAFMSFDRTRLIEFDDLSRELESDWNATQFGASAQAGYRMKFGRYGLTAAGNINYVKLDEDGYTEVATSGSGFEVDDRKTTSFRAGATLALDALFAMGDDLKIMPTIRAGYLTELSDDEIETRARFAAGGDSFLSTTPVALDDTVIGGVGLVFLTDSINVSFNYDQERASDFISHTGSLTVRIKF
ncbi:autotransporter [Iodidimonas muriae]|uniref:Autotransporter n=2 Tax=Iodidimonas muriae TaxID=261467 RepID=A0ABQ2LEQ6_9PROT|nr:autotransporter [Kordiimonadales bacterium JCM 17843]GGO13187.1 autotransporter [Iodidimonas muriae]